MFTERRPTQVDLGFSATEDFLSNMKTLLNTSDSQFLYKKSPVTADLVMTMGRQQVHGSKEGHASKWVLELLPEFRQYILTKQMPPFENEDNMQQNLPFNAGGETIGTVYYIVENYDRLPDVMIFSQADILGHVSQERFVCIAKYALSIAHMEFGYIPFTETTVEGRRSLVQNQNQASSRKLLEFFSDMNITEVKPVNILHYKGIFATTRRAVRAKPLSFWKNIYFHLVDGYHGQSIETYHFMMERYWHVILDPDGLADLKDSPQGNYPYGCPGCCGNA